MNQVKEETKLKFHKVKPYMTPPNWDFFETSDQLNTSWLVIECMLGCCGQTSNFYMYLQ